MGQRTLHKGRQAQICKIDHDGHDTRHKAHIENPFQGKTFPLFFSASARNRRYSVSVNQDIIRDHKKSGIEQSAAAIKGIDYRKPHKPDIGKHSHRPVGSPAFLFHTQQPWQNHRQRQKGRIHNKRNYNGQLELLSRNFLLPHTASQHQRGVRNIHHNRRKLPAHLVRNDPLFITEKSNPH